MILKNVVKILTNQICIEKNIEFVVGTNIFLISLRKILPM